jgi:ABC-type maltose transport system permease subunit
MFYRITLPLSKPILAVPTLFVFIFAQGRATERLARR